MFVNKFYDHENMKKLPRKVEYIKAEFPSFKKLSLTAQTEEFMFSNVAYRATVYKTGALSLTSRCVDISSFMFS